MFSPTEFWPNFSPNFRESSRLNPTFFFEFRLNWWPGVAEPKPKPEEMKKKGVVGQISYKLWRIASGAR